MNVQQNSLALPQDLLTPSKYGDVDTFNELAKATGFLPRFQLFGANSDAVKMGKMTMAHYALVYGKDQYEDLGSEVNVFPISWRPRAMDLSGESPISYFNPKTQEFQQIQARSEEPNSGCVFGPEFLIYVPKASKFATYFMASKTSRRQAPDFRALIGKGATLRVQLIQTQKYTWHGPVVSVCSIQLDVPDVSDISAQKKVFDNPEDSSIEFDPEKLETARDR